eukprot:13977155-Alexandrium_andersonii.AAC.1
MSASLVGSEMCIRDSTPTPAPKNPGGKGSGDGDNPQEPLQRELRENPVSYTHLTLPTICSV